MCEGRLGEMFDTYEQRKDLCGYNTMRGRGEAGEIGRDHRKRELAVSVQGFFVAIVAIIAVCPFSFLSCLLFNLQVLLP